MITDYSPCFNCIRSLGQLVENEWWMISSFFFYTDGNCYAPLLNMYYVLLSSYSYYPVWLITYTGHV